LINHKLEIHFASRFASEGVKNKLAKDPKSPFGSVFSSFCSFTSSFYCTFGLV
jgi:hypothetical protein